VAAAFAQANLELVGGSSTGAAPQRVVLELPDGQTIGHSNAALRYIAKLNKTSGLYGVSLFDSGLVDQWVDFSFMELEIPSALLTFPLKGWTNKFEDGSLTPTKIDIDASLTVLDKHLSSRTFLVGEKLTIADIAAVCAVLDLFQLVLGAGDRAHFANVTRWFMTCTHQPEFADVIGSVVLCSETGSALSVAATSSTTSSGSSGSTSKPSIVTDMSVPAVVPVSHTPTPYFKERFSRNRERVKEVLAAGESLVGSTVVVKGWIKQLREADKGAIAFIELNDGSCMAGLQIVADKVKTEGFAELLACGGTGACLACEGEIVLSPAKGQKTEMACTKIDVLGVVVEPSTYPLKGKRNTLEFMRENAHLRPRSNLSGAAMRVRNAMAFATHKFFNERGFVYVHTPLITASDCEGAGEMFTVTTLLPEDPKEDVKRTPEGHIDYAKDFFGRHAHLTVSGQLNVETHNCALSDVYTFGPTFRAENSNTSRHLAEFWMIEPEIAFADLNDDMDLAEDFLKYCTHYALTHCREVRSAHVSRSPTTHPRFCKSSESELRAPKFSSTKCSI
jgi:aspartyl/asparaginyl-tRNA synthetase/glutathione S-transferase